MTMARIYLADKESGKWLPLMAAPQDPENVVQLALANSPELIPGDQIDPDDPCRWLLIESEAGDPTTAAAPSLVLVDQNAVPNFIMCGDSTGKQDHSRTVAAMIGLATLATTAWRGEKVRQAAEETAIKQGLTLEKQLLLLLGGEPDGEAFWAAVDDNLRHRRLRLIFVSDTIADELWQMLQFLDRTMRDVQVLALEMKQYRAAGQTALLPRLVGYGAPTANGHRGSKANGSQTTTPSVGWIEKSSPATPQDKTALVQPGAKLSEPDNKLGGSRPLADTRFSTGNSSSWNESTFFDDLAGRIEEAQVLVAKQIFNWAKKNTSHLEWGGGITRGAFAPVYEHGVRSCQLFIVTSNGWIELNLRGYESQPPFNKIDMLQRLYSKLCAVEHLDLPGEALEKRALLPLSLFTAPSRLAQFLKVFEWAMMNMGSSSGELRPDLKRSSQHKTAVTWPAQDEVIVPETNGDRYSSYESSFDDLLNRKRVELDDGETDELA